jgi:uncharacterized protein
MSNFVTRILVGVITLYQKILSPDTGLPHRLGLVRTRVCVFYPTCSEYAKEALLRYGPVRGIPKIVRRLLRCHPWQTKHIDPLE